MLGRLVARLLVRRAPIGNTLVDRLLFRDVVMTLAVVIHLDPEIGDEAVGDADWHVVAADVVSRPGRSEVPGRIGPWTEVWTVERGGRQQAFAIGFTPDATGTGFAIQPPGAPSE